MRTKLSRPILITFTILALVGLINGVVEYVNRPDVYPANETANDAIGLHLVLAILSVAIVIIVQTYRARKNMANIWLALFSTQAFDRFKMTFIPKKITPLAIVRILLCLLPTYLILWTPFRSAMQITAAFDPSFTANAWGGPSYIGASLAHWLDGLIFMYIGALLIHWSMAAAARRGSSL